MSFKAPEDRDGVSVKLPVITNKSRAFAHIHCYGQLIREMAHFIRTAQGLEIADKNIFLKSLYPEYIM